MADQVDKAVIAVGGNDRPCRFTVADQVDKAVIAAGGER